MGYRGSMNSLKFVNFVEKKFCEKQFAVVYFSEEKIQRFHLTQEMLTSAIVVSCYC